MLKRLGLCLTVLGYLTLARGPLLALLHPGAESAGHDGTHGGMAMPMPADSADPWHAAVLGALALAGIVLAVVPLFKRGERWALWTSLAIWMILAAVRLSTDPRCLLVLDPHQHGCHTFVIALVTSVVGLACLAPDRRQTHADLRG